MTEKKRRSLSEVVKERLDSEECILCVIPERQEIEAGRKGGAEIKDIVTYLIEDCGYDREVIEKQRQSRIGRHFRSHTENG